MKTNEKKVDVVNVEEIMGQIRDIIKKHKESGANTNEMEDIINQPLQTPVANAKNDGLQQNLNYINYNWDLHAVYQISSHRPVIGRLLTLGRGIVHGEVRRYVDLIAKKQSEFNLHVGRSVKSIDLKINNAVAAVNKDIDTKIDAVNKDIDIRLNKAVATQVNGFVTSVNKDIENKAWLAGLLEKRIKSNISAPLPEKTDDVMNYFVYKDKFRGSTEDIRQRQSIYIEFFKNCQNVLDIGCCRGEFLSLLKEKGIGARGIDLNEDMVLYCRNQGLDVQKAEALSHLQSLDDKSLDGVFSAQVVEHLHPEQLIIMIRLCYDKMKYGTNFIAETINPLCLSVFTESFYMDLSHVKPVHPETIKFLLESVGFRNVQIKYVSPFPDNARLQKFVLIDGISNEEKNNLLAMNQNIDKINSLLYGYQEYAVIGTK